MSQPSETVLIENKEAHGRWFQAANYEHENVYLMRMVEAGLLYEITPDCPKPLTAEKVAKRALAKYGPRVIGFQNLNMPIWVWLDPKATLGVIRGKVTIQHIPEM